MVKLQSSKKDCQQTVQTARWENIVLIELNRHARKLVLFAQLERVSLRDVLLAS